MEKKDPGPERKGAWSYSFSFTVTRQPAEPGERSSLRLPWRRDWKLSEKQVFWIGGLAAALLLIWAVDALFGPKREPAATALSGAPPASRENLAAAPEPPRYDQEPLITPLEARDPTALVISPYPEEKPKSRSAPTPAPPPEPNQ